MCDDKSEELVDFCRLRVHQQCGGVQGLHDQCDLPEMQMACLPLPILWLQSRSSPLYLADDQED